MASPFNVFRKNQRIWMAIAVGFAMFAFIVADSINAANMPIFLGATLGAVGLWLLSNRGGTEGWLIAAVGGVVGAILGAFLPGWIGSDAAVLTNAGNLTQAEVTEISQEQNLANEFLYQAFGLVHERTPDDEKAALGQPSPFRFVDQVVDEASQNRNAALTFLFQKKADELGIELSDKAVEDFIKQATGGKLTKSEFREAQNRISVGSGELYDILRNQLRAREAFLLLSPLGPAGSGPASPTPVELWNEFSKTEVQAEIDAVTIPVADFVSEVKPPQSAELQQFFEQYKTRQPLPDGTPGFEVPRTIRLAYLELLSSKVRESVKPPTDEEVLAHYNANKARYEFSQDMPAHMGGGGESTPAGNQAPAEASKPGKTAEEGAATENPSDAGDATKSVETPAENGESSEQGQNNEGEMEAEATAEPASEAKPGDGPAPEDETEADVEAQATEDGMSYRSLSDGHVFVAYQSEAPKPTVPEADADAAPEAELPEEPAPDAKETPKGSEASTDAEPEMESQAAPGQTAEDPMGNVKEASAEPNATEEDNEPATATETDSEQKAPEGPSQETLDQIFNELMNARISEAMDARQKTVRQELDTIITKVMEAVPLPDDPQDADQKRAHDTARTEAMKKISDAMKRIAEENDDVDYRLTPAMSGQEMYESEKFPVGKAVRWRSSQSQTSAGSMTVTDEVFRAAPDQPVVAIDAQSEQTQNRFIVVKVADNEPRVPKFNDKGVKEKVTDAWEQIEARKLAEERAAALAKKVNDSKSSLAEVVKGQTITGDKSGQPITVANIGPFSWMERSSVPSMGMQMPALNQTALPELPEAGEDFMETVFDNTSVGNAGTARAIDGETFYVVQVKSRTDADQTGESGKEFLGEDFFSDQMNFFTGQSMNPYRQQEMQRTFELQQDWMNGFLEQYEYVSTTDAPTP